jgi:uncharacterized protein (DUF927 family)
MTTEAPNGGRRRTRAAIIGAAPAAPYAEPWQGSEVAGFTMDPARGLYRDPPDKTKAALWICGRFDVLARTRDAEGEAHGLLLRWRDDADRQVHEWIMPFAMLAGDATEVRARLASGGLIISPSQGARAALLEFLTHQRPKDRVRTVPRVGWFFGPQGGAAFVLPGRVHGALPGERVMLDLPDRPAPIYRASGSLKDWSAHVAARCAGNTRLMLSVSLAFAGPLLTPLAEEGGGVQLRGASRLGKSTALKAAASVWGPPEGPDSFKRSWRATGNGIEGLAAQHNDALLPLDELGEMDPRDAGGTAYMLGNGTGKARAHRTGTTRPVATWRLLFLSTGEESLADMLARAGHTIRAGQEVRFIDLPAEAGKALGLFDTLHTTTELGAATAGEFAELLTSAAIAQHGTAGPAFLDWLAPRIAKDAGWAGRELAPRIRAFLEDALPDGASGQVRTVCRRFALVAVAGELATEAGITGWQLGAATDAARACFDAWCAARGSVEAREDLAAVEQVRACLAQHGQARFELWKDRQQQDMPQAGDTLATAADAPVEARAVPNRLGWRKWIPDATAEGGGRWEFYFTGAGWKEATRGLDPMEAAKVLMARGYLRPGKKDGEPYPSRTEKVPGVAGGARVYAVCGSILGGDGEPERPE